MFSFLKIYLHFWNKIRTVSFSYINRFDFDLFISFLRRSFLCVFRTYYIKLVSFLYKRECCVSQEPDSYFTLCEIDEKKWEATKFSTNLEGVSDIFYKQKKMKKKTPICE